MVAVPVEFNQSVTCGIFHSHILSTLGILKRKVTKFMGSQLQNKHCESTHTAALEIAVYSSSRSEINTHACRSDSAAPFLHVLYVPVLFLPQQKYQNIFKTLQRTCSPTLCLDTEMNREVESKRCCHRTY